MIIIMYESKVMNDEGITLRKVFTIECKDINIKRVSIGGFR